MYAELDTEEVNLALIAISVYLLEVATATGARKETLQAIEEDMKKLQKKLQSL